MIKDDYKHEQNMHLDFEFKSQTKTVSNSMTQKGPICALLLKPCMVHGLGRKRPPPNPQPHFSQWAFDVKWPCMKCTGLDRQAETAEIVS